MSAPVTLVVGMGATGRSVIRHLAGREPVLAIDTRPAPPYLDEIRASHPQVELLAPGDWPQALAVASRVVASPGLPLDHCWLRQTRAAGVPIVSDIALFLEAAAPTPVIGVTGTNGKSTVVSLLGEVLAAAGRDVAVGGNLGTPALALLAPSRDIYALELSSFQLERLERPGLSAAAVLNVDADHADRHPRLEAYAAIKRRIYAGAAHAVFNAEDPRTFPASVGAGETGPNAVALNGDPLWRLADDALVVNGVRLPTAELALRGRHNHFNVLAAAAIAWLAGVQVEHQRGALRGFAGLPHRCEHVATIDGVAYVNDSKATNVGACCAALEGLANGRGNIVLIAGGDGKGSSFDKLAAATRRHVSRAFLIGRDAGRIEQALGDAAETAPAASMAHAVRLARASARPGDTVLLSPACASFDMYANFEARGDAFAAAVRALAPCPRGRTAASA